MSVTLIVTYMSSQDLLNLKSCMGFLCPTYEDGYIKFIFVTILHGQELQIWIRLLHANVLTQGLITVSCVSWWTMATLFN